MYYCYKMFASYSNLLLFTKFVVFMKYINSFVFAFNIITLIHFSLISSSVTQVLELTIFLTPTDSRLWQFRRQVLNNTFHCSDSIFNDFLNKFNSCLVNDGLDSFLTIIMTSGEGSIGLILIRHLNVLFRGNVMGKFNLLTWRIWQCFYRV